MSTLRKSRRVVRTQDSQDQVERDLVGIEQLITMQLRLLRSVRAQLRECASRAQNGHIPHRSDG